MRKTAPPFVPPLFQYLTIHSLLSMRTLRSANLSFCHAWKCLRSWREYEKRRRGTTRQKRILRVGSSGQLLIERLAQYCVSIAPYTCYFFHNCDSSILFDSTVALQLRIPIMGSHFISTVVSGLFLLSTTLLVEARRGLNPDELHLLTRGTDYTFHSICADFKNPDLFFDEWVHFSSPQAHIFNPQIAFLDLPIHFPKTKAQCGTSVSLTCQSRNSHVPSKPSQMILTCTCGAQALAPRSLIHIHSPSTLVSASGLLGAPKVFGSCHMGRMSSMGLAGRSEDWRREGEAARWIARSSRGS